MLAILLSLVLIHTPANSRNSTPPTRLLLEAETNAGVFLDPHQGSVGLAANAGLFFPPRWYLGYRGSLESALSSKCSPLPMESTSHHLAEVGWIPPMEFLEPSLHLGIGLREDIRRGDQIGTEECDDGWLGWSESTRSLHSSRSTLHPTVVLRAGLTLYWRWIGIGWSWIAEPMDSETRIWLRNRTGLHLQLRLPG
ncbi:MAG: hypothetical protein H6686_09715 [Fibrobacteria bacterium]|nr:hypothetical protein [Fibrobacteria bacterium]